MRAIAWDQAKVFPSAIDDTTWFLGWEGHPFELGDRATLEPFLSRWPEALSGYTFPALIGWSEAFAYRWEIESDTLLVSCVVPNDPCRRLLQPVGVFGPSLQSTLLERASKLAWPLKLSGVSEPFLSRHADFVSRFDVAESRDGANYVYGARDLAELPGKKYSKKRNHLAQAARQYQWTTEPLTPERVQECLEVVDDIASKRSAEEGSTLEQETEALTRALHLFGPLGLCGLLIRVEGKPSAFSIFDRMSPNTAVVLFERALRELHGMYQVVNQETAQVIVNLGYELINREEDLGDPGLRKAKLSYYPTRLERAFTLTFRP